MTPWFWQQDWWWAWLVATVVYLIATYSYRKWAINYSVWKQATIMILYFMVFVGIGKLLI